MKEEMQQYKLHHDKGRYYLTLRSLEPYSSLRHLFTTRLGGVSKGCCGAWNFGSWELDSRENILRNYEILAEVLGVSADRMVRTAQTHTANVKVVSEEDAGKGVTRQRDYDNIDGLVTNVRGVPIVTGHADCNAVFFFDPRKEVIGLAHSGWRGTLAGISRQMLEVMQTEYGCCPADIITGLGPALCQNCFEVDLDVAQAFFDAEASYRTYAYRSGEKYYIDLKKIIRQDLLDCGILPEHFSDMCLCTKCGGNSFFSYRRQKGKQGIMAAAMMLV